MANEIEKKSQDIIDIIYKRQFIELVMDCMGWDISAKQRLRIYCRSYKNLNSCIRTYRGKYKIHTAMMYYMQGKASKFLVGRAMNIKI